MNELDGYDIEDLKAGMSATFAKTITEADIVLFASASGDNIAGRLPGPGTIYLGQNLRFKAPVRPGDTVHATVTVKELFPEKRRVALTTVCIVNSKVVIEGDALVMPTSRETRQASPA
jgi:3-hydroxybutyryl-CoA dehydratase